ncbi:MAG: poly(A) polymerase [Dictyoglomus sp. NZ13-RE01]|nr:MAG: poly(A) polymerase [Dictyoglomus sp. NZ13-RE01]
MQVILSHNYLDFDALSSLYAAKKLYPQAIVLPSKSMERKVYEFYSLYKDFLKFHDKPPDKVEKIILVDNHWLNRIDKEYQELFKNNPVIEIYDHHKSGDIKGDKEFIEEVGATTTILLELIIKNNIPIDPVEATLFALGIYQDTGNFTFSSTTARDLKVASLLLERGANISIINYYIKEKLSDEQKNLLAELIQSSKEEEIRGFKIVWAPLERDKYVEGLSILAHMLLDEKEADALFIMLKIKDKVYLMGRTRTPKINLLHVLEDFDPGGHPSASTVVLTNRDLKELEEYLRDRLKRILPYNLVAKNIMSYPVETISPETTISEAHKIMTRLGYGGLCVVENNKLVGIISRRDVEKAINLRLYKRKVKSFMSKPVITVDPETSLSQVERIFIEKDIGRVPVVKDDKILGIITRQDVLKFHFIKNHISPPLGSVSKINEDLVKRTPWWEILLIIRDIAEELNTSVYAIGGFVRDLLLNYPNMDLDITVEGDVKLFLNQLIGKLKGELKVHEEFGTAEILLEGNKRIDIATTRIEYYPEPGALPKVEKGSFWLDLKRRDFTINTLALSLNKDNWLEIIDFYGGLEDLVRKELRVLHNLSFIEDPSRILRGIRLEQRLNFNFEEKTLNLLKEAIEQGFLTKLSKDRIKEEILLILREPEPEKVFKRLEELSALPYLLPINNLPMKFEEINIEIRKRKDMDITSLQIINLLRDVSLQKAVNWLKEYHFSKNIIYLLINFHQLKNEKINDDLIKKLIDLPKELTFFLALFKENHERQILERLIALKEKHIPYLKGRDLLKLGFKEGRIIGDVLKEIFMEHLKGNISTKEDEINLALKIAQEMSH